MDRLINYLFIFVLIGIFVLEARALEHRSIILGTLFSVLFCIIVFFLNWLSLDGARSGMVLGSLVFGLGGIPFTFLTLFFFLSSTLISGHNTAGIEPASRNPGRIRRDGLQVWSNGFWLAIWLMAGFIFDSSIFLAGAVAALATATADTWATELGSRRFRVRTYLLNGSEVEAGTDGGISIPGTLAALAGSLVISFLATYLFALELYAFLVIFVAGYLGCLADSYFGAQIQHTTSSISVPFFKRAAAITVDNNLVNWMATGTGSLLAIILMLVFE